MDYTLPANEISRIWGDVGEQRKADSAKATPPEVPHFEIVRSKRRSESTITVEPNESLEPVQFTPSKSADDFNLAEFTANAKSATTDSISRLRSSKPISASPMFAYIRR
jgi:hypothetical protein